MSTRIYFIRHGESKANLLHQFAGSLDMPLTEKGVEQAKATASFLSSVPISTVYSSDLSRALNTGAVIAKALDIPLIPDKRLREIFAGEWEGKTYAELEQRFPVDYGVWRTQIGLAQCTGGESVAQLQARVWQVVEDIVRAHRNETVCIATHATPIRVMESLWAGIPFESMHTIPWVGNASVTIVEYDDEMNVRLIDRDITKHLGSLRTVLAKNV